MALDPLTYGLLKYRLWQVGMYAGKAGIKFVARKAALKAGEAGYRWMVNKRRAQSHQKQPEVRMADCVGEAYSQR